MLCGWQSITVFAVVAAKCHQEKGDGAELCRHVELEVVGCHDADIGKGGRQQRKHPAVGGAVPHTLTNLICSKAKHATCARCSSCAVVTCRPTYQ